MGPALAKTAGRPRVAALAVALAPYLIALWFGVWSLRGLESGTPVDTDAARHAMNGVFFHDLVRHGDPLHLVAFAKSYYSRYPSLSMPYHPPLFPAVEALFFFGLGVNFFAARVTIALATAITGWLMYHLALRTHASHAVAAASTVLFLSLPSSLILSSDVMLEMPTLTLALAAMLLLPGLGGAWSLRRGMAYALVAAAAVWSKQNVVFLGLVPFAYAALEGRWRAFKSAALWVPACVFGVLVVALAWLAVLFGVAGNGNWPPFSPIPILSHNVPYYADVMRSEFGTAGLALVVIAVGVTLVGLRRGGGARASAPYLAWIACVFAVAFLMPPYDSRYVFFAYPALAIVVSSVLLGAGRKLFPERLAWLAPAALAALGFAAHIATPPAFVKGPAEAAKLIAAAQPDRVLYCGRSNGNFIFALRALDPELRTAIIRGDKLPLNLFAPAAFEKFAHDYGVQYIVLERSIVPRPWYALLEPAPRHSAFLVELPLASSDRMMNGSLQVFRFLDPSRTPESTLQLRALGVAINGELPTEQAR
ncbi:MAG TPA: glycosyltransferase family 39 protein [Bryobacteraceae bacterium]